jgi:hypothetical protein
MNRTDRDTTRVVRSWLDQGADRIPDRVLDAVEAQLHATPQRRAGWLARRFPNMNNTTVRYGLAAIAVVVIALLGVQLLPGNDNVGGPGPTPPPTPTVQPTPTTEPRPAFPELGTRGSPAGRYVVGSLPFDVTVEVPAGWSSIDDWIVRGPRGTDEPAGMAIRFFADTHLYQDPTSENSPLIAVGPTVADMVQAIVDHAAWEASDPTEVTLDGRAGQMVALTIPTDVEIAEGNRFRIFSNGRGGQVWGFAPGQTFELYIVDVDGQRLIIDAWHHAGTSEEDLAAQRAVVQTIQFDATP